MDVDPTRALIRMEKVRAARMKGLPGVTYTGGAGFKTALTKSGLLIPIPANDPGETDAGYTSHESQTNLVWWTHRAAGAAVGANGWQRITGGFGAGETNVIGPDGTPCVSISYHGPSTNTGAQVGQISGVAIGTRLTARVGFHALAATTSANFGISMSPDTWGPIPEGAGRIVSGPGILTQPLGGLFRVTNLSYTEVTDIEISRVMSPGQNGAAGFTIYPNHSAANTDVDIGVWWPMFVTGTIVGPRIKCATGAAATRTADALRFPCVLPASGATVWVRVRLERAAAGGVNEYLLSLSDGTFNNRISLFRALNSSALASRCVIDNVNYATAQSEPGTLGVGEHLVVATVEPGRFAVSLDGVLISTSAPPSVPVVSQLLPGLGDNGAIGWLNDRVLDWGWRPRPISDAALRAFRPH